MIWYDKCIYNLVGSYMQIHIHYVFLHTGQAESKVEWGRKKRKVKMLKECGQNLRVVS